MRPNTQRDINTRPNQEHVDQLCLADPEWPVRSSGAPGTSSPGTVHPPYLHSSTSTISTQQYIHHIYTAVHPPYLHSSTSTISTQQYIHHIYTAVHPPYLHSSTSTISTQQYIHHIYTAVHPPYLHSSTSTISTQQYIHHIYTAVHPPYLHSSTSTISTQHGDSAGAQAWCESTTCPSDPSLADQTNCCVHHVNVHSCPMAETDLVTNGLCGPWIPAQGSIFTHSDVMVGSVLAGNWTSVISGLYQVGLTSLIAHFKIAGMHLAVEKTTEVLPKTVCGDDNCEVEQGENCDNCPADCGQCPLEDGEITLIAVAGLLVVLAVCSVAGYFKYQRRKLLWDESWIVAACDIVEDGGLGGLAGSTLSLARSRTSVNAASNARHGNGLHLHITSLAMAKQLFGTVATVHGNRVHVKRVHKRNFQLTKQIRVEIRHIRSLDHPNLCRFMGGCVEPGNVCILYEYCPKGSLSDVIQNDSLPLNWSFRLSLVTDVARGMAFLHKNKLVHGHLKSSNCVVDDRWVCKVTDFGLKEYRREDEEKDPDVMIERMRKATVDRVYVAPEDDTYGQEEAENVSADWKPCLPDLPTKGGNPASDDVCPSPREYRLLIGQCWAEIADDRPTFDSIRRALHRLNPNKLSPVDMMLAMMANYQQHLESVVEERTKDLQVEKERSDHLLHSMLPRQVADHLRQGECVKAEQFESCTIYFSDIVGFTTISAQSTPLQVVALLNKLYTTFDAVIEMYHVYKVETIGDAYMVVSGVPDCIEDHARHVALMSLDLVRQSRAFSIPHMPGEQLRIRVGLHSGSVCAGVVGTKMPRYCLFGDTVNTASRMESTGEAYKIHISDATYQELHRFGEFTFEHRGTIAVKVGKGDMVTWWLTGTAASSETVVGNL
ncbi:hypothetical protein BaRGS_00019707 [Batillaria attramentaria]|uniref:Guanylate cyclase n=1 Tax=Batillaria attramentaria TaxID=370345 RepID=A0ABD0KPG8_9CAEN